MADPAETPQTPSDSVNQTIAQRVRGKYPGAYDDMDDYALEAKVLQKFPQYGDLPRTHPPAPTDQIANEPTGVLPWLKNLESDFRYGGEKTLPGKALHFLGARGVNVGAQSGAADTIASPILGPMKAAQGVAELPSHPWQGTKDIVKGGLQTATIPASFMAPAGAESAASGLGKYLPIFASKSNAVKGFQEVMAAGKNAPVQITPELSQAASDIQAAASRGGSMPKVVRDFIKRATDPNLGPLTYEEARGFASNASRMSADEMKRLTPAAKYMVGKFHGELNKAIQDAANSMTAAPQGMVPDTMGQLYGNSMKEFAQASQRNKMAAQGAKAAIKYGVPSATGAWFLNRILGRYGPQPK